MEDTAQTVTPMDVEAGHRVWFGDRLRQRMQRPGVRDPPVGSVDVVVRLVFVQGMQQTALVPDQGSVQQFVAAALDPPFHDGVHARHVDAAEQDPDIGVGEDRVDQRGDLAVTIANHVPRCVAGVGQVHGEIPYGLGDPRGGGIRGGAHDADAAAGVLITARVLWNAPGTQSTESLLRKESSLALGFHIT